MFPGLEQFDVIYDLVSKKRDFVKGWGAIWRADYGRIKVKLISCMHAAQ